MYYNIEGCDRNTYRPTLKNQLYVFAAESGIRRTPS
nr:MAG TPA: hypothetical protein [Caudoviricetes sp.]